MQPSPNRYDLYSEPVLLVDTISSVFDHIPKKVANVCEIGNVNPEKVGILKKGEVTVICQGRKGRVSWRR